jgi:uncharacterized protein (TIGR03437 family)
VRILSRIGEQGSPQRLMKHLFVTLFFSFGLAAQVTVTVPGNRVITLAGQPAGTQSSASGRSAPGDSPVAVGMALTAGQALQITATGAVDGYGPDGVTGCRASFAAEFSVARVTTLCRALVGMFLADTRRPQPAAGLEFSGDGREIPVQRPLLQQPFLIGSGTTSTGAKKAFIVPAGATRLFLSPVGTLRSEGEFTVTVRVGTEPETPGNPVRVSAVSTITLAGQAAGTLAEANDSRIAPLYSPAVVSTPLAGGQVLRIVATGNVEGTGPDGAEGCTDRFSAEFGIARVDTRCRALVGVFLADTARSQPPNLNYTGATRNTVRVEPLLQQPFLIGSGYTDGGEMKQFVVPAGATRFYMAAVGRSTLDGYFTATVSPVGSTTPVVERTGVLRAAGFGGGAVTAGSIASIFGSSFAAATETAGSVPLPVRIGQTRVYLNLWPAPLYFTSSGQVNAQIPWELAGETSAQLVVVRNGAASLPVPVDLAPASPGIFLIRENTGVVVNAVTGQLVDAQTAVRTGDTLVIYASGLGAVTGAAETGVPASSTELEPTRQPVEATLTVGGRSTRMTVLFAGSAPGFIGVNQVNAVVPDTGVAGVGVLKLQTRGAESNGVSIAVER